DPGPSRKSERQREPGGTESADAATMASIHALRAGPGECERPYRYPARAPFELLRQPRRAEPRRPCEARIAPGLADFKSGAGDIAPRDQRVVTYPAGAERCRDAPPQAVPSLFPEGA